MHHATAHPLTLTAHPRKPTTDKIEGRRVVGGARISQECVPKRTRIASRMMNVFSVHTISTVIRRRESLHLSTITRSSCFCHPFPLAASEPYWCAEFHAKPTRPQRNTDQTRQMIYSFQGKHGPRIFRRVLEDGWMGSNKEKWENCKYSV